MEIAQMKGKHRGTTLVVKMDNRRDLDISGIIKSVGCWYEEIARSCKAEVEVLHHARFQELQEAKGKYCNDLKCNRHKIAELRRWLIQKLQSDFENVKKQVLASP